MIYLGADHRGFELKEKVKTWLAVWGYKFKDLGNTKLDLEDDYPDFARKVAEKVSREKKGEIEIGILICESGVGVDVVANKYPGVRCGLGFSGQQIRIAKRDDNINCLALSASFITETENKLIIEMFLETQFSGGGKYQRRISKIEKLT